MTVGTSNSSAARAQGISIGIKIFGIATSLLGLLILVVYVFTDRLRQVNEEVTALAEYVIPITDRVAAVDVHALEQELHFERVQKLYEIEPLNTERIAQELIAFESRGELVDAEIAAAIVLSQTALKESGQSRHQAEWEYIEPLLEEIEIEHQQLHDHAVDLFALLEAGDLTAARQLEDQLIAEETDFNEAINTIFLELEAFTVSSAQAGQQHQQTVQSLSLTVAAVATVFGLIYAILVTRGLVRPVRSLARGIAAVQAGNLDTEFDTSSRDEVGRLAQAFNGMVNELRLKARLEETFGKYIDPRIVHNLLEEETAQPVGDRQVMTVFFADVDGLEMVLATLDPDAQIRCINDYLTVMSAAISSHTGVIDKFIGTLIMGFWGPPFTAADTHANLACQAALAQMQVMETVRQQITAIAPTADVTNLQLHIGLSTGALVVGNMGSETTKSYTVMGDTVNTASRLKGASKQYGVPILLSQATQQQIAPTMATRELDLIQVVGKAEPVRIYELLGPLDTLAETEQAAVAAFEQGLAAYRQRDWVTARQHFEACLASKPGDRPALLYLDRLTTLAANPPADDWDGVWQLTQK
ncbi:MAG: HAMP domain-containing protein [Leptolyngbya sp. SIOISBB]|nr:HAMP domain-containing protein [Leptolyngbya sp. SIOISBB]